MKISRAFSKFGIAACLLSFASSLALADTWRLKDYEEEFKFKSGIRILQITRARENLPFHLKIYNGNQLLADYPGFSFDYFAESPDDKLIVGLSNSGLANTAIAVFDHYGSLQALALHGIESFDYCEMSITVRRQWYDEKNPNVRFDGAFGSDNGIRKITVRNCHGEQVRLFDVIEKSYRN